MTTSQHEVASKPGPFYDGEIGVNEPVLRQDTAKLVAIGGIPVSAEVVAFTEKLHHKPLVLMEVDSGQKVSLTRLENFKPEVQPGGPVHEIPETIRTFTEDTYRPSTLIVTESRALWQQRTLEVAERYARKTEDGQKLMAELGIDSLQHLTPEQAVKFSTEFVRSVSKYSFDDTKINGPSRADNTASFDLLHEGLDFRTNPSWIGNGVCRNIAANVKIVFESLKASQGDDTMLANTYCAVDRGDEGNGYDDKRANPHTLKLQKDPGHAWNIFTTIGESGSAVITIVDSTWALGANSEVAAANADRTAERAGKIVNGLFEMSVDKEEAFASLTQYYTHLATFVPRGKTPAHREQMQEYALTQYLHAARQFPEGVPGVTTPSVLLGSAYRSSNKLDPQELATLYYHDKANGDIEANRIKAIFKRAYEEPWVISGQNLVNKFLFSDNALQQFVFSSLGEQNIQKMSDRSIDFRIRLREIQPGSLPAFDPTNPNDLQELKRLAQLVDIYITASDPSKIVTQVKRRVSQAAGNEQVAAAILVGRSDYDIVKHAPSIIKHLRTKV